MSRAACDFKFRPDGTFKIMLVGDMHEKCISDAKSEDFMRLLNKALDELRPDVAIMMGDIISGNNRHANRLATPEEIYAGIQRITEPYVRRGIPFGLVFGNHDGESGQGKELLLELFQRIPGCIVTDDAGVTGVGNCYVPILGSDGKRPLFNLWLMDSGNRAPDGSGGYAWVDDSQIAWYERTGDALKAQNGGKPLPALLFQHIPVCEEYDLLREATPLNPYRIRGHGSHRGKFYVKGENCSGYLGEGPAVPTKNNGQFASWQKQGDVIGAFFGHDHQNDFVGMTGGIVLGQCKCAGFHIYGDGLRQGVRMIALNEARPENFETKMHYYRDFFGTRCNTIKGYDLLTDRWHLNFKITLAVLGAAAGIAGAGVALPKLARALRALKKP